ncbi:MAG TPA: hypothetical protein VMO26_01975 [Vicinamibacterales bacterium]|nr:hypothetical protein [Vicinamibacterales bacterium]
MRPPLIATRAHHGVPEDKERRLGRLRRRRQPLARVPRRRTEELHCALGKIRSLVVGYVVIALLTGWPLALVVVAGVTAWLNGCTLNEAGVHPCIVGGRDIGATLYSMGMTVWFLIALIPVAVIAGIGWTAGCLIWTAVRKRRAATGGVVP